MPIIREPKHISTLIFIELPNTINGCNSNINLKKKLLCLNLYYSSNNDVRTYKNI